MDLRKLIYFLAVAEDRHFRRASERLNVSQPSLTRAVQQLEDEIGAPLFSRSTRKVELSPSGKVLLEEARNIVSAIERAKRRAARAAGGESGEIRISYTEFAIKGQLPDILNHLRLSLPDLEVNLQLMDSWTAHAALSAGEIDIAYVIDVKDELDLDRDLAWKDHLVAVMPSGHRLAKRRSVSIRDLLGEPIVLGSRQLWGPFRLMIDREFGKIGAYANVVQEGQLTDHILGLVSAGIGITLYSDCIRNYMIRGLSYVPVDSGTIEINNYLVWDRSVPDTIINHIRGS